MVAYASPSKVYMTCPECGCRFPQRHHRAMFCSPAHQKAYNNRQLSRGQRLVTLAQAWRGGRSGSAEDRAASTEAFTELCRLISDYNEVDKKAGRPSAARVYRVRRTMGLEG